MSNHVHCISSVAWNKLAWTCRLIILIKIFNGISESSPVFQQMAALMAKAIQLLSCSGIKTKHPHVPKPQRMSSPVEIKFTKHIEFVELRWVFGWWCHTSFHITPKQRQMTSPWDSTPLTIVFLRRHLETCAGVSKMVLTKDLGSLISRGSVGSAEFHFRVHI